MGTIVVGLQFIFHQEHSLLSHLNQNLTQICSLKNHPYFTLINKILCYILLTVWLVLDFLNIFGVSFA